MVEGQIYSYTSHDNVADLCFSTEDKSEFGIGSVSMIRFADEVSLLILAGRKADLTSETAKAQDSWADQRLAPHRTHITRRGFGDVRAEQLSDAEGLWKTVVLMRIDGRQRTVDARYVMPDLGASYQVITDDLSAYFVKPGELFQEGAEKSYKKSAIQIKQYEALFELGKTFLKLPGFFTTHDEDVVIQRHPTEFKPFRMKLANKKIFERVDPKHWMQSRDVYSLSKPSIRSPSRTSFVAPQFRVETSGYWKKVPIDAKGVDKHGNSINGRTWVTQTLTWLEEIPDTPTTITSALNDKSNGARAGLLYVMRSAAHEKNIFKIGLTTRNTNDRSKELSRATGSPDHFLTVQEWATSDCFLAEALVHKALSEFRINPNREFFKADYKTIFSAIDKAITRVEEVAGG